LFGVYNASSVTQNKRKTLSCSAGSVARELTGLGNAQLLSLLSCTRVARELRASRSLAQRKLPAMAPLMTPLELKTKLKQVRKELESNETFRQKAIMKFRVAMKKNTKFRLKLKTHWERTHQMLDAVEVDLWRKKAALEALAPSIRRARPVAVAVQVAHVNVDVAHAQHAARADENDDCFVSEDVNGESDDSSERSSGSD
jgi:seryl-tRNA synthetase